MENRDVSELSFEEIVHAIGGALDASDERSINFMIRLLKMQGRKMEEVYQFRDLPDEQREYIRRMWYKV